MADIVNNVSWCRARVGRMLNSAHAPHHAHRAAHARRGRPRPGLIAGPSAPPAAAAGSPDAFARQLDEDRWLAAFEVPGVAVALVRDGQLTWSKGYGQADTARGVPVTPDTVFQVGSISKPVTAWGVMRLVQQGKLDLDAPVDRYLTRWHLPPAPFDADGVTIRRLLNHSAGLNSQDYSPIATRPLPSLEQSLSGESGGVNARRGSDDVRITMTPGQQRSYSNGGYTLLQLAIEEVTGEPFARYMQREVLDPLGMTTAASRGERTSAPRSRPATTSTASGPALRVDRAGSRRAAHDRRGPGRLRGGRHDRPAR